MATVEIEFHCLCLFVRDEENDVVHVVMPKTHPPHEHLVMLYHASFPQGRRMHGLELVLSGDKPAMLETLENTGAPTTIVDLTQVTNHGKGGRKLKADRVNTKHRDVLTRVKLYSGKVTARDHEAQWIFRGVTINMAYKVVWQISGVPNVLIWNQLDDSDVVPIHSLSDIPDDGTAGGSTAAEKLYKFRIFHTMPEFLPPNDAGDGDLDEDAVRAHFKHFYDIMDHTPRDEELPRLPPRLARVHCGTGQVLLQ